MLADSRPSEAPKRIALVVGARPNLVKAAPLLHALNKQRGLQVVMVHTGQHYDDAMSGVFLRQLDIREPDVHLRVGSGSHAEQTARIMVRLERYLRQNPVDRLLVVGDVNSTLAASLVAAKLCVPIDHVEAGLRSGDRRMPEEINRLVTDSVASRFFASEPAAVSNLLSEGKDAASIHHVGNVMIDSLVRLLPAAKRRKAWRDHGLRPGQFAVATLHRPANVDDPRRLQLLVDALQRIGKRVPILFPVHPRTRRRLRGLRPDPGLRLTPPLGYLEFLSLMSQSRLVITDSGGIQEETTALGIPCLTLRETTERPITVTMGSNTLVGSDLALLEAKTEDVLAGRYKAGRCPPLWDGKAARRIATILLGD